MAERTFKFTFLGDAANALRAMGQIEGGMSGMVDRIDRAGQRLHNVTGLTIRDFASQATSAVRSASDLQNAQSKSNQVFRESSGVINDFARNTALSLGLSQREALATAGSFGNMFTQLGFGTDEAAKNSIQMIQLAADFAAFHDADITQVLEAQAAAFRGEYDSVQRFVPTITAAAVQEQALKMGLAETTDELTAQDKALATQTLLLEGAGDAVGAAAREYDSFSSQQRRAAARTEDLSAKLGGALLPAFEAVQKVLLATPDSVLLVGGALLGVGAAIGAVALAVPLLVSGFGILAGAAGGLATALTVGIGFLFSPAGLILVGIAAVIAAGYLLWKNWDTIKEKAGQLADWLGHVLGGMKTAVVGIFEEIAGAVGGVIDRIGDFLEMLGNIPSAGDVAGAIGSRIPGAGSGVADAVGGFFGGFRAAGGPIKKGMAYLVGEKGAELFVAKQDGVIIPNSIWRDDTFAPESGKTGREVERFRLPPATADYELSFNPDRALDTSQVSDMRNARHFPQLIKVPNDRFWVGMSGLQSKGQGEVPHINLNFYAPLGATSAEMQRIVRRALTDAGIRGIGA